MDILLVCVGRCRQAFHRDASEEYARRIGRYASFELREVREHSSGQSPAAKEIVRREGERLLRALPDRATVVALDRGGVAIGSEELARWLSDAGLQGKSRMAFVIGGPYGLSPDVVARSDRRLSLSRMTFPHELARVVLLEQIYRAFTIVRREPYHK